MFTLKTFPLAFLSYPVSECLVDNVSRPWQWRGRLPGRAFNQSQQYPPTALPDLSDERHMDITSVASYVIL